MPVIDWRTASLARRAGVPCLQAFVGGCRRKWSVPARSTVGPIPGASPLFGDPDTVNDNATSLTARRIGNAWLVAQSGIGETERLAILHALEIARD